MQTWKIFYSANFLTYKIFWYTQLQKAGRENDRNM